MPQDNSSSTSTTSTTVAPTTVPTTVPAPTTTVPVNPANQQQGSTVVLTGTGAPVYAGGIDPNL
jgi:hypothetical protein